MSELQRPIRDGLDKAFSPDEVAEVGARISALEKARVEGESTDTGNRWMPPVAAAAVALLGVFAWQTTSEDEITPPTELAKAPAVETTPTAEPLRLTSGELPKKLASVQPEEPSGYSFIDGSQFKLEADTELVTSLNDGEQIEFDMAKGNVDVYVKPGGPRRWTLHTELADIEVIGTRFNVTREPDLVHISVQEGKVLVRSPYLAEQEQTVTAGESLTVTRPGQEPVSEEPDANTSTKTKRKFKPWRELARGQKFGEAYKQLGEDGLKRETKKARTVSELFDLADVARLSGHPKDAVEPLEFLVHRFPHDKRAGIASFTLGNLLMTQLTQPRKAAESFERAIAIGVPAALRETAYVRAIQMRRKAGDKAKAQRLITTYLAQFPNGHHSNEVRGWANELKE